MHPTDAPADLQAFPTLARSFRRGKKRRGDAVAAAKKRAAELAEPVRPPDPERRYAALEDLTAPFRSGLAKKHRGIAKQCRGMMREALEVWDPLDAGAPVPVTCDDVPWSPTTTSTIADFARVVVTREKWHRDREGGQRTRFARVRTCGYRMIVASCKLCGDERKGVPEGCGVARVCPRCSLLKAKERRGRFGRSRGRVLVAGVRKGLTRKHRAGGRYGEKMLTLTVPHMKRAECTGIVGAARDDVDARVLAAFKAWPIFLRFFNRAWRARNERDVAYHRAFEWTPGTDNLGHPHFHVYLWCPFVPVDVIKAWWAHALRAVGVPIATNADGTDRVVVNLRAIRGFNPAMVVELMKGGRRSALTLSRIAYVGGGGQDAHDYSEGWTIDEVQEFCSPEVQAALYMALEGRRLSQASQGFFVDDDVARCACCGGPFFRVRFEPNASPDLDAPPPETHERAPP